MKMWTRGSLNDFRIANLIKMFNLQIDKNCVLLYNRNEYEKQIQFEIKKSTHYLLSRLNIDKFNNFKQYKVCAYAKSNIIRHLSTSGGISALLAN